MDLPIRLKGPIECPKCGTISVVAGRIWQVVDGEFGPWRVLEIPCHCNRNGKLVWIRPNQFPGVTDFSTRCDQRLLGRERIGGAEALDFLLELSNFTHLPSTLAHLDL